MSFYKNAVKRQAREGRLDYQHAQEAVQAKPKDTCVGCGTPISISFGGDFCFMCANDPKIDAMRRDQDGELIL